MAHSKLYIQLMNSSEWRALRAAQLTRYPECSVCAQKGLHVAAQCVHHMVPVESGKSDDECTQLAFAPANLQSLCFRCHAELHKAERSHSREAHQEREGERMERWIARREAATRAAGAETGTGGTVFFEAPHRLPNPLRLSRVDGEIFENADFPTATSEVSEESSPHDVDELPLQANKN